MSGSLTPTTDRFPLRTIKGGLHPPLLIWLLPWLEKVINLSFLSSDTLKLQSNPNLRGEIWAKSWVSRSIFKQEQEHVTSNLCVFVTLWDSSSRRTRSPSGATKVVVSPKKFVLFSPSWGFDSEEPNLILVIVYGGLWLRETRSFVSTSTEMLATFVVSQTSWTNLVSCIPCA
jgi:hypothetical protein